MVNNRVVLLSVLFLLFLCGCRKDKYRDFDRMVLNNKVLEREIIKYRGRSDQVPMYEGTKVYTSVWCKTINDSTERYTLCTYDSPDIPENFPFIFICKVGGEDVFFIPRFGLSRMDFHNNPFKWSADDLERFNERYVPEIYYNEGVNTGRICISHPELCYLTFVNDSLVGKAYKRGWPFDRVKVRVGGKEYFW